MDSSKTPVDQQQEQHSSTARRRRVSTPVPVLYFEFEVWVLHGEDDKRDWNSICFTMTSFTGNATQKETEMATKSSGPSYDSLMNYKRSNDPNSMARRASLNEQKPQSGFFGSMWYNFVRGPTSHNK
ncbi:hypothetical protein F4678DRAFT_460305 [Xylaria arbuscula]|nr:hypothetical protein F4678DRAFT_460305 [Xylaria arbuscula]